MNNNILDEKSNIPLINDNHNNIIYQKNEQKIQYDIDRDEKESSWLFCYNKILLFIKPAYYKLLRDVTSVGSALTGQHVV